MKERELSRTNRLQWRHEKQKGSCISIYDRFIVSGESHQYTYCNITYVSVVCWPMASKHQLCLSCICTNIGNWLIMVLLPLDQNVIIAFRNETKIGHKFENLRSQWKENSRETTSVGHSSQKALTQWVFAEQRQHFYWYLSYELCLLFASLLKYCSN